MTRYSSDHKAKTRKRLLETARREFREHGFERASIEKLMKAAGLTRGGFYAHFESKEALVREVLRLEPGLLGQLRRAREAPSPRAAAADAFARYLAPEERGELIYCPLVAHPMDATRGGAQRTALYAEQVHALVAAVRDILGPGEAHDQDAIIVAVLSVGAAILSSAIPDAAAADRIEAVCRDAIRQILNPPDSAHDSVEGSSSGTRPDPSTAVS